MAEIRDPENTIIIELKDGPVVIELLPAVAPKHADLPDLPAEFSREPHARGTLGAARSSNPNSANSQFFINFKDNSFLNGQYTVYGRVVSGMEHVDKIARGEPPQNPDRMISVRVAADVQGGAQ
jgi:cyclophilin family peptidyl-prolyl cis-trans isomerase